MSGIVGIFNLEGRAVDRTNLQSMVDVLAHRGPDGSDIWCDGAIGLGHRMLWTTPESLLEKLPMTKGSLTITADARIDNREELIPALGFADYAAEKITDVDLILTAYEQWGEDCPKHLLGDFAFAIWDGRSQHLFCARDHFGVRPFYYYRTDKIFIFASEIKAILCHPDSPRQLNVKRLADSFATTVDHKHSFYQHIFRLPPAHSFTVQPYCLQSNCYWVLDPSRELKLASDQEYSEKFLEIFTKAVSCRLRSAFPIGSHLSGGLDSSSVACIAQKLLIQENKSPLHTFSNIFDNVPTCDERPFIEEVLEKGGFIPHYVHADFIGPLTVVLDEVFEHEDEGYYDANHRLVWGLDRAAQQAGVRVVLNGFDGDTTVSLGLLRFTELARSSQWASFNQEARSLEKTLNRSLVDSLFEEHAAPYFKELAIKLHWITFFKEAYSIHRHLQIPLQKLFVKYGLRSLTPLFIFKLGRKLRNHRISPLTIDQLINSEFSNRIGLKEHLKNSHGQAAPIPLTVREEQWLVCNSGIRSFTLELLDRTAAQFSLEARHPFMDKRLIEFCLSLPPEQKLDQGWNRIVMRRAMTGILPEKVQWRPSKTNMTPNFVHGLLVLDQKRLQKIFDDPQGIQNYINFDIMRSIFHTWNISQKINPDEVLMAWKVLTAALWIQKLGLSPPSTSLKRRCC